MLPLGFEVEVAKCPLRSIPLFHRTEPRFLAGYTATWNTDFSEVPLQLELAM